MQVPREGLVQKLQRLSASQQSIESVSSFCIFYHKDARGVVQIWDQEFYKASPDRRLALLFLANHILQEGRKKGMGFQEEFFKVLPKTLSFISKQGDDKIKKQAGRLVSVWEERRVFGTKHIKSFKDVIGVSGSGSNTGGRSGAAAAAGAGGGGGGATSSNNNNKAAAVAAAASELGPVGQALVQVNTAAAVTAGRSQDFNSSWSQASLSTAGLPAVTAAHTQLAAYTSALQEELTARQAALTALGAETARQVSEVSRLQSQLQSADGQKLQLEQQMAALTQQMTSAMASLGQFMQQQQNGGVTLAQSTAADTPPAPGSPEAPELELEDDEEDDDAPPSLLVLPSSAPAAAAAPGVNGGPLGGFLQQQQHVQSQSQEQQQPPAQPLSGNSLQALLGNPAMLSAAILGGAAGGAAGSAGAAVGAAGNAGAASVGSGGDGLFGTAAAAAAAAGGNEQLSVFGGFGELPGTFSAPFGGLTELEQAASGFADEGDDDPYDPTLEG